ncbi:hypothetical protein O6H91_12G016500 [Diphasiastrum complanatum]|uniref:Uncharacterized protein n=2 Tax=Diphasiastrum complanatum TaxID=34168 RepID=A0ACC2BZ32_DIPCM|nr:hypothetical protein O6H91_12G016500 [Diphasiastrum complanatum]KAJ7535050.1 hypothetical protein O6H91_12G016500 [Diphasiastrum complanatum]
MEQGQVRMELQPGDYVSWKYGTGKVRGHVMEKLSHDRKLGARIFKATAEDPKYLLKIDKSGKEVIRKGETLERIDSEETKQDIHEEDGTGTHEDGDDSETGDRGTENEVKKIEKQVEETEKRVGGGEGRGVADVQVQSAGT